MKKLAVVGLAAVIVAGVFAFMGGGTPSPERVGYFKSEAGNRVMAYVAPEGMTESQAHEVLGDAMHTPGKLTFAVIYRAGRMHPGHRLTGAPDYRTAAGMLDQAPYDGWAWGAVINAAGQIQYQEK